MRKSKSKVFQLLACALARSAVANDARVNNTGDYMKAYAPQRLCALLCAPCRFFKRYTVHVLPLVLLWESYIELFSSTAVHTVFLGS